MKCHLRYFWNVLSTGPDFCASDNFADVCWSVSVKSSTARRFSKCCCQCGLQLLRTNFKHSCNQVSTIAVISMKITVTVTEVVLIQMSFLTVGSKQNKTKQKKNMKIRNTIESSFTSKVKSTYYLLYLSSLYFTLNFNDFSKMQSQLTREFKFFSCFGPWSLVLYLRV